MSLTFNPPPMNHNEIREKRFGDNEVRAVLAKHQNEWKSELLVELTELLTLSYNAGIEKCLEVVEGREKDVFSCSRNVARSRAGYNQAITEISYQLAKLMK